MQAKFSLFHFEVHHKTFWGYLASWIIGLLLGIFFAYNAGSDFFSMMREVIYSRVSIVDLLLLFLLPYLVYFVALSLSNPLIGWIFFFIKACSYGFSIFVFLLVFRTSGWLCCLFLSVSGTVCVFLSNWFWIRRLQESFKSVTLDSIIYWSIAILVIIIDYFLFSPFWLKLVGIL